MSDQLPDAYWDSMGETGVLLKALLASREQQIQQLQQQVEFLNYLINTQNFLVNAASVVGAATAQHNIIPTPSNNSSSDCLVGAADPKKFSGDGAETEVVISKASSTTTSKAFTRQRDLDHSRAACNKLHGFRMTPGMSADEYTIQFDSLARRTGFNEVALEDAYCRGLSELILDRIYSQPSLPCGLEAWKDMACRIDRNHRRFLEFEQAWQGSF